MSRTGRTRKFSQRDRSIRYTMRRLTWVIGIAAVIVAAVLADRTGLFGVRPTPDVPKYDGKTFRVVKVIDGDTLDIAVPDGRHDTTRIRLLGVDTPETNRPDTPVQHFGPEAKAFTTRECLNKDVRLELMTDRTRGKYGRLLAYVYLPNGKMLNRVLVSEGFAYADPRFEHRYQRDFRQIQGKAMRARLGLWASVKQADLPGYYRHALQLPDSAGIDGYNGS